MRLKELVEECRATPGLTEEAAFRELVLAKAVEARAQALRLTLKEGDRAARLASVLVAEAGLAPSDDEVRKAYEREPARFERPMRLRLAQIVVRDPGEARALAGTLARYPDRFGELARRHSQGPEGADGGVLGEFALPDLPAMLAPVAQTLRAGQVSPVIETPYGLHLVRVLARLGRRPLSFEEAAPAIRRALVGAREGERLKTWMRRHVRCEVDPAWARRLRWSAE